MHLCVLPEKEPSRQRSIGLYRRPKAREWAIEGLVMIARLLSLRESERKRKREKERVRERDRERERDTLHF